MARFTFKLRVGELLCIPLHVGIPTYQYDSWNARNFFIVLTSFNNILGGKCRLGTREIFVVLTSLLVENACTPLEIIKKLNKDFSYLWTYDLCGPIRNAFDAGRYIARARGRGWALKIETF